MATAGSATVAAYVEAMRAGAAGLRLYHAGLASDRDLTAMRSLIDVAGRNPNVPVVDRPGDRPAHPARFGRVDVGHLVRLDMLDAS